MINHGRRLFDQILQRGIGVGRPIKFLDVYRTRLQQDRRLFPETPFAMRDRFEREWLHNKELNKVEGEVVVQYYDGDRVAFTKAQKLLGEAVYAADLDEIARALASGADINKKAYDMGDGSLNFSRGAVPAVTALWLAAYGPGDRLPPNQMSVVRFLLCAGGADPNADLGDITGHSSSGRCTPCYRACVSRSFDAIRVLIACGARPDHCLDDIHGVGACHCPGDIPHPDGCMCDATVAAIWGREPCDGGPAKIPRVLPRSTEEK